MRIFQLGKNVQRYCRGLCRHQHQKAASTEPVKSVLDAVNNLKPGHRLHGYTVQQVAAIPEFEVATVRLCHDRTGAQHFHVAKQDSNNTFSVCFRTTPLDNTGVPHVLEHTVLCGSEKFPVRDPFFKMLNRSMATFMNAFTGYDWTIYPFSTQNHQDFYNLMAVYLDAAFYPNLNEMDFSQEGWRLEHENLNDKNSPIVFKGVVFNEMKGIFSNPQYGYIKNMMNKLLPSHTYSVCSGGDPLSIPDLTWSQLKHFHSTHYHPSNARFFTYGDMDLGGHLKFIDQLVLKNFDRLENDTRVPDETRWTSPRESSMTCRPDPMAADQNKQTTVAISYLLCSITDAYESFVANMICTLLTSGETSPYYQSLLEANIGADYAPILGYDGHTKEATFSIGLQGISASDIDHVTDIIDKTLDKVIQEGIPQENIDALLHRIELSMKHQTTKFGLDLAVGLASLWNHDGDPISHLQISERLQRFRDDLKSNARFIQDWIKVNLKENSHRLKLSMSPDTEHEAIVKAKEAEKLASLVNGLSETGRQKVYDRGLELSKLQNQKDDLSCLPTLKVPQLRRETRRTDLQINYADGVAIQSSVQPTNGVTYLRALIDTSNLSDDILPYMSLFVNVLTKMAAGSMDFKEFSQQIDLNTGGLSASSHVQSHHTHCKHYEQGILLSSYSLDKNVKTMLNLWSLLFEALDLSDLNRLQTLVRMSASDLASSLSNDGHQYAMTHAQSHLDASAHVREKLGGIEHVKLMKRVAEMPDLTYIQKILAKIQRQVLNKGRLRCAVNATHDSMDAALRLTDNFIEFLPGKMEESGEFYREKPEFKSTPMKVQFQLPFAVNYCAKSIHTGLAYSHPDYMSIRLLARLMSAKFLHREVREKGGAYGSGASLSTNGNFTYFSYRDPNSVKTLNTFDQSIQWAMDGQFDDNDVDEAKLSVFQQLDHPVAPGDRGMTMFLSGITDDMRQTSRDRLFEITRQDITQVAQKYLSSQNTLRSTAFLGPENAEIQARAYVDPENPSKTDDIWVIKRAE